MLLHGRDTPADIGPDAPARAGPMNRSARAVRTRWRALFLLTGAVLTTSVSCWPAARFSSPASCSCWSACCHGIGSSGCTSADQLAGWPGRG